jgi:hypothetical protein
MNYKKSLTKQSRKYSKKNRSNRKKRKYKKRKVRFSNKKKKTYKKLSGGGTDSTVETETQLRKKHFQQLPLSVTRVPREYPQSNIIRKPNLQGPNIILSQSISKPTQYPIDIPINIPIDIQKISYKYKI